MGEPTTIWVVDSALTEGVRIVLSVPHERIPGYRRAVGAKPGSSLYALRRKDYCLTEAEALKRVKRMLVTRRRRLQREHLREMARLLDIGDALKAGRLPMAKERK